MEGDSVAIDGLRKLTEAQALVSNVSATLCNSINKSNFESQMERFKEFQNVQKSLLSLAWNSMTDIQTECNGNGSRHGSTGGIVTHDFQQEGTKKNMHTSCIEENCHDAHEVRKVYDEIHFQKHMKGLEEYYQNIEVRSDYNYSKDGLVIAFPHTALKQMSKKVLKGDIRCIDHLMYIQRNPVYQLYQIPGFHYASHWSEEDTGWTDLECCFPSNKVAMLRNDMYCHNLDNGGIVLNYTEENGDAVAMSLAESLKEICYQIHPHFDLKTAKGRKVPSIGFGFTDNNPNEYKKNRVFSVGKMKRPNLMSACHGDMESHLRLKVALLAAKVIRKLDPDIPEYEVCGSAPYTNEFFNDEFANYMGMDWKKKEHQCLKKFFTCHGISIILNGKVAIHEDSGNPSDPKLDKTYSINTKVKVRPDMWQDVKFKKILKKMGIQQGEKDATISVSMMIYKKKCVQDFITKWSKTVEKGTSTADNPVQPYLFNLLSLVDTEHNYSKLFHDKEVRRNMVSQARLSTHPQPCFSGKAYRCPESFDRTAYLAGVFDECIAYGVNTGQSLTKADIIGNALFLGGDTNGTLLWMGVMELLKDETDCPNRDQFLEDNTMYSLLSKACQKLHKKRKAGGYNTDIWGYLECERHQLPNRDIKKPSA